MKERIPADGDYKNMAVAQVTATVTVDSSRKSHIEVFLEIVGPATSLEGGTLLPSKLSSDASPPSAMVIHGATESVKAPNGETEWRCRAILDSADPRN